MSAYRVNTVITGLGGSPYFSTHWLDKVTVGTASDAAQAVGSFWDALTNAMVDDVAWQVENTVVEYSTPDTPITAHTVSTPPAGAGSGIEDALPLAAQGMIRWQTGAYHNNRRVQGRTFVPGPPEGSNTPQGTVSVGYQGGVENAAAILVSAGIVVASRAANQFFPVGAAQVWDQWAVLRSRRD